ncbi:hypothetical protein [Kineosporia succinea]|uniref:DUF5709 domain-containing protein n=1 Tax=Kineosporia succinea TaxID=84632 RepID=A0ABT9P6N9_9ACTN|nr:hypothetical protein [Kineosporia succinea]MDP9828348.1 hypothetical protein [Kineosporia succinea]
MVTSMDASGADVPDGLELVLSSEPGELEGDLDREVTDERDRQPVPQTSPGPVTEVTDHGSGDRGVLRPGDPEPAQPPGGEDLGTGVDLLDGVDPEPEYRPALIDIDDESMALVPGESPTDAGTNGDLSTGVEVEDTLMAVDDYGDVL